MRTELIEKLKQYNELGKELYKSGLIGIHISEGQMQFSENGFIKLFKDRVIKRKPHSNEYKYKYFTSANDVYCFCISNKELPFEKLYVEDVEEVEEVEEI